LRHMWVNTWRIGRQVWREKRGLVCALAAVFAVVAMRPFMVALATGVLIDRLIDAGSASPDLVGLLALFVAANTVPALGWIVQTYLNKLLWYHVGERVTLALARKKGELDVAVIEDPAKRDLINKVNENGAGRVQTFVERQFWSLQNVVEVVLASCVLLFFSWWVFLLVLACTVPCLLAEMRYGRETWSIHGWHAEKRRRYWDLNDHLNRAPWLIELKVFQAAAHVWGMIRNLLVSFQDEQRVNERRRLWAGLGAMGVSKAAFAFAVCWFVYEVAHGHMKVGSLVFVLAALNQMRDSLSGCFQNVGRQYEDSLFVTDVFRLPGPARGRQKADERGEAGRPDAGGRFRERGVQVPRHRPPHPPEL
jgi:ABC-type multidrug transport system fused ATPase/permease subunit